MISKKPADYQATIRVEVSALQALAGISNVKAWWTQNVEGSSKKLGDCFYVRFGDTYSKFEIIELEPGQKLVWLVLDCNLHWLVDKKEWKGTRILWEVETINDACKIHMTHVGLVPSIECFENCRAGWNHYVKESLYKLLNEGRGVPDHADYSARERQ